MRRLGPSLVGCTGIITLWVALAPSCGGGSSGARRTAGAGGNDEGGGSGGASGDAGGSGGGSSGSGGNATAGSAGAAAGTGGASAGTGGTTSVGVGGSVASGGASGGAVAGQAAGMSGAVGGQAGGGSGTAAPIDAVKHPPGPAAASATFFAGTDANVTKLVATDPMPGYFYAMGLGSVMAQGSAGALSAADATGLPAGVTYAYHMSAVTQGGDTVLVGFNFRPDAQKAWQWIDVSQYAGITFWAKVGGAAGASIAITPIDATNLAENEGLGGACPATSRSDCSAIHGTTLTATNTWQQVKLPWSAFTQAEGPLGDLDVHRLGRFDLLHTAEPSETSYDLYLTGIKFATAAELQ